MKLYNISEPEAATVVIGIDLGTTNSLVATKSEGFSPKIIEDADGRKMLPSAVLYDGDKVLVGHEALSSGNSITSIKRLLAKGIDDLALNELSIKLHDSSDKKSLFIDVAGQPVSPVQVSAEILKALKERAELHLQASVSKVVITVPAYFDDASRNATRMAAKLAGLEVMRLINEPTAAAIAYGLDKKDDGAFLIYDLGGGTFDVSIVSKSAGVMQVIATAGDIKLGGDDFDLALLDVIREKYQLDVTLTGETLLLLRKIRECFSNVRDWHGDFCGIKINITRAELDLRIEPFIKRTVNLVQKALSDAELSKEDVGAVIMVGGATRTPLIKSSLELFFGKAVLDSINPDEIVAMGAAEHAYNLLYPHGDSLLVDVVPLSLGIEVMGGLVECIIPRNTPIPIMMSKMFTNYTAEQTGIYVNIFQGEGEKTTQCRSLGRLELKDIPKLPAGELRVEVNFAVDADGILTVEAVEKINGIRQEIALNPTYGLSEDILLKLLINNGCS